MSDLSRRLTDRATALDLAGHYETDTPSLLRMAADEIERLRAVESDASPLAAVAPRVPAAPAPVAAEERERLGRLAFERWRFAVRWEQVSEECRESYRRCAEAVAGAVGTPVPAAPAPCPECGGCLTCQGTGRLWRVVIGGGREQVPCPRCAAGESARSAGRADNGAFSAQSRADPGPTGPPGGQ